MEPRDVFQMPGGDTILSRTAAMRSTFVRALIPAVTPSDDELACAFSLLDLEADDLRCVYCGGESTEWDHFFPVMSDGRPNGYLSIIENLVPACSKCNQSKGNSHWRDWMMGSAPWSPSARGVADVKRRVKRLENYESWGADARIDLSEALDAAELSAHWESLERIIADMRHAHSHAEVLKRAIADDLPELVERPSWLTRLWRWIVGA